MSEAIQEQNENIRDVILKNMTEIRALCFKHFVKTPFVFGSILTEHFDNESDVDLLFDINKLNNANGNLDYVDNLFQYEESMSSLLNRKIDLIPDIPVRNKYMREGINRNKRLLYASR